MDVSLEGSGSGGRSAFLGNLARVLPTLNNNSNNNNIVYLLNA